jgi:hypothetical protein
MAILDRLKAKQSLRIVRDFILRVIVPDDAKAKIEINEIFNQLLGLLDTH